MNNTIRRTWNMYSMVNIDDLRGMTFQDEALAHTFEITGLDENGEKMQLTGTVGAIFLRADNTDVAIVGSMSDGVASVTLPAECYDCPGHFGLTVYLINDTQKTAIYAAIGNVKTTSSGTVSPETSEDVADLIAEMESVRASIPAEYDDLWTRLAPAFDTSTPYALGQYVTYDGKFWRFNSWHSAGSWSPGEAVSVNIGEELSKLRGAMNGFTIPIVPNVNRAFNVSGSSVTMSNGIPQREAGTSQFSSGYLACQPNDVFTISGTGGNSERLWAFIASDGTVLRKSITNNTLDKKIIVAPPGAAFILVNTKNLRLSFKNITPDQNYKNVHDPVNLLMPDFFCAASDGYANSPAITETGVRISCTSGEKKFAIVPLTLKANTEYVFYSAKNTHAGIGFIRVTESTDGGKTYSSPTSGTFSILMSSEAEDNTQCRAEFTTTTGLCRFYFFMTGGTASEGDIEYYNLMLAEKGKDPGAFVPYFTAKDHELREMSGKIRRITGADIIQGTYNRDGSVMTNANRIRIRDFIPVSGGDIVHFTSGANAQGILCGFVNEQLKVKETSYAYAGAKIVVPYSCQLMLVFKRENTSALTPDEFDADVYIEFTNKKESSGDLFRCDYAEAIPQAASSSSPYPMTYSAFIQQYENFRDRITTLYADYYDIVPLDITRTTLATLESGNSVYQYEFTPPYPKKTVFIIAGMHGDEYEGMWSLFYMLRMIYAETTAYPELKEIRENIKFVIIPVVNPDGFEANTRANADGINILDCFRPDYSGEIPAEFTAITTAAAGANFDYFMDFHTDPYEPSNGCYGYALQITEAAPYMSNLYKITNVFRDMLKHDYNFLSGYKKDNKYAIVGRLGDPSTAGGSVGYMWRNYGKPGNLVEIGTDAKCGSSEFSFAHAGSSEVMMMAVDWYTNVLMKMYKEAFGNEVE